MSEDPYEYEPEFLAKIGRTTDPDNPETEAVLEEAAEETAADAQSKGPFGLSLKTILIGCVAAPLLLGVLCLGITLLTGLSLFNQVSEQLAESGPVETGPTPLVTLIPTADLAPLNTATPLPSPTPTPAPATAEFSSPTDGGRLNRGEQVDIKISVQDDVGLLNVQLLDNDQTVQSWNVSGDTTFSETTRIFFETAGNHTLRINARNLANENNALAEINVRVIDQAFIDRNQAVFNIIDTNVTAVRGLSLLEQVEPQLMGRDALRRYFGALTFTEEDANEQMLVLSSFDFVPRGFPVYEMTLEYLGSNIAGFYNPEDKAFVMVSTDNDLDAFEQFVYAHELMHALQDQHFDLDQITSDGITADASLALRSLAEGEATLLQELYLEGGYFSANEAADIFNITQIRLSETKQYRTEPPEVLVEAFNFPYTAGLEFARTLYNRGGWPALDEAWSNPPQSSEQVMHPERYFNGDNPQVVSIKPLTPTLGTGWRLIEQATMGELYLREYLALQLPDNEASQAAAGWGGDAYAVYWNETADQVVMVARIAWDSPQESSEFGSAYADYANAAFGSNATDQNGARCRSAAETLCTFQSGSDWIIVRAPTLDIANTVLAAQLTE